MSLRDQLNQIAEANATVALDRKVRQKLYSTSLIYNPKTAATQDLEFIFEAATAALDELIELDPKFEIFTRSIFSESSMSIDRNVQTKEENKNLDNAINGYLMLASSKWHLTPTLHATEWLVRRFQIHIRNAEPLLLSTLNYYQSSVFKRILNIVKLPPLFNPLSSFVKAENRPSNLTIIKLFNDMDFLKLYANYLNKSIKHKATYTNQLLFVSCSFLNLIAFNSNNEDKLNLLVPILLEISAKLLASDSADNQIAANTILSVFASALPLNKNIILAATETILANLHMETVKKSSLITIFKLFQTLKGSGNVDHLPIKLYNLFDKKLEFDYVLQYVENPNTPSCDKFISSYIRTIIRSDHTKLNLLVKLMKNLAKPLQKYEIRLIITDLIHLSEVIGDKSNLIEIFEYLVKTNENLVLKCLKALNMDGDLFELRLTTSLFTKHDDTNETTTITKDIAKEKIAGKNDSLVPFKEFLDKNSNHIFTHEVSLFSQPDEVYSKLLSLFIEAIGNGYQSGLFLSSFFTTLHARLTFLLRVLISPAAPVTLRSITLTNISKYINSVDKDSNVFTLVPCLICALNDISKNVRIGVKKILTQIAKRPSSKHYFIADKIYGDNVKFPLLSPKDSESWLKYFLNEYLIEDYDISHLLVPKNNENVFLLFWANQALVIPLPFAKTMLLNNICKASKSTSTYSSIFEDFISNYLDKRSEWELKCQNNKTDFGAFEKAIIDLFAPKEKNEFMINFSISALKSEHESLASIVAEKIITVFQTLKSHFKNKIIREILEDSLNPEQSYDAIGTLQSLPLDADGFTSILNENRLSTQSDISTTFKRRRRSSSTNKAAFQKEQVSKMAELHLRKLTIILEALDRSNTIIGTETLLSTLLSVLSDLETLDLDGGLPVLYCQETLSSCMINCIHSLKNSGAKKLSNARADILVSAIRNSSSTQVQNKLLLVVGELASLDTETVLHSVMPIFTFMGAHSIRQDDEFTTQVVTRTIETVIPALLDGNKSNISDEIEFLLISFTTALQHVPKHRRVNLYFTLIKSLNATKAIAPFLFLISQHFSTNTNTFKLAEAKTIVEFTRSFLTKFDVTDQLNGICKYFEIYKTLIEAQKNVDLKSSLENRALFTNGILNIPTNEFTSLLQNGFDFINKVIQENESDYYDVRGSLKLRIYSVLLDSKLTSDSVTSMKNIFSSLLESILKFINKASTLFTFDALTDEEDSYSDNENRDTKDDIKRTLYNILGNILNLLPIEEFTSSVLPLLSSIDNIDMRYHLTLVISNKFEYENEDAVPSAKVTITKLLERISLESENVNIQQVSLNTISSLISKFDGKIELPLVNDVLSMGIKGLATDKPEIIISSLTAITNCVQQLGVKIISFYPKIVPQSLQIFAKLEKDQNAYLREQQQLAILLMLASMIRKLPSFLQSNLYDLMKVIFLSDEVNTPIRLSIISLIAENMDLKEVLKVLNKIWNAILSDSTDSTSISLFLSMLESTVESIDKKSATIQSPVFFKLLLALFEYRSKSSFDTNTISRIESTVHQIVNIYVLKLNDKVFRPLFAILVRWAFDGEGVINTNITEIERLTAFYRFFYNLQDNLKGIITSYFTYILEPTKQLLDRFVNNTTDDINLRRLTLMSVTSSFKYDKDEYWKSTSRFELISKSLIDQLSNIEQSIGKYLVKAISSLATNNNGVEGHNKIMHKLLVDHMKATCSSNEKLWAVRCFKMIYTRVGESWLPLLPQLVPTIAELLEDDNEEVEHEVRTGLVKVVENVLGEPFSRYLD
ncbi:hypothetical protein TBLA_0H02960 [Henningerozyma blattae CBS 6284]|uniref:U3 small nucleolar RNA-associated protein 10 n=1 Tax=Henningerozyma blattae (strain ATCC 34711 / CBS 6284 / DSM 70876 / NBRC 10599 / NRRL Y-10934 / UCD 77-7) TaxID=1071380 RepID=I2H878_HENB6|nr:hypothetical protein TBLA_0H02960 [Tetrapisispora blattae CBS 6284]CCH62580.1 hypothetical protein TBLA_0H02960 [Tetrapisispora blattae CBS 6284]